MTHDHKDFPTSSQDTVTYRITDKIFTILSPSIISAGAA